MTTLLHDPLSLRGVAYIIFILVYVGLLGWSWWMLKQRGLNSRRGELPMASLVAFTLVTLSFLIFLGTQTYSATASPANTDRGFPWVRVFGCILAVTAMAAALGCRGWRRISGSILSSVLVFLWTLMFIFGEVG